MVEYVISNNAEFAKLGCSSILFLNEIFNDKFELYISRGATSHPRCHMVEVRLIYLEDAGFSINLFEIRIFDNEPHDNEYEALNKLIRQFEDKYSKETTLEDLVAFTVDFSFRFGSKSKILGFLNKIAYLHQSGVKTGRRELQGEIKNLLNT